MVEKRASWLVSDIRDMKFIHMPDRCLKLWCNLHGPHFILCVYVSIIL